MKRKIALLMAMALLLATAATFAATDDATKNTSATQYQTYDFVKGTVTASVLNVRQGPSTSHGIVNKLEKGSIVSVLGKIGDWYTVYQVDQGLIGAVHSKYVDVGEAKPTSTILINGDSAEPVNADPLEELAADVSAEPSEDEQALLDLVNKARKDAKVGELTLDKGLMKIAELKAREMVEKSYFSHESPVYGSPFDMMKQFNIAFKCAGENIAGNKTVEAAFNKWIKDEAHKKNILNAKFTVTGIGVVDDPTYGKVIVQQFIGR